MQDATLDAASDAKDVDSFSHRPHLPPPDSDEADKRLPPDLDAEDKDKDGDGDAVEALLVLLPDRDPPSQQSQQDGRQGTRRLRQQGGGYYARTPPPVQHVQAPPYSNLTKRYVNWNACYSCGFDVPGGHTNQTCPHHMRKPDHDIHFTRQNAQQYINQGYTAQLRTATRRFSRRCDG